MTPSLASKYLPHRGLTDSEALSEHQLLASPGSVQRSDLQYLSVREFSARMERPWAIVQPALRRTVLAVRLLGPVEQMARSDARRIVAGVADHQIRTQKRRLHAVRKRPGHTMRQEHIAVGATGGNASVSSAVASAGPQPAGAKFRAMFWNRAILVDPSPQSNVDGSPSVIAHDSLYPKTMNSTLDETALTTFPLAFEAGREYEREHRS